MQSLQSDDIRIQIVNTSSLNCSMKIKWLFPSKRIPRMQGEAICGNLNFKLPPAGQPGVSSGSPQTHSADHRVNAAWLPSYCLDARSFRKSHRLHKVSWIIYELPSDFFQKWLFNFNFTHTNRSIFMKNSS